MIQKRDIKLLACLRGNSRESITNISKKTKIPASSVFERIKHHKKHTIRKFCALLDFSKFGYTAKACVLLKTAVKEDKPKIREYLCRHANVNSVFSINNGYDYMTEIVFTNIREMEDFLEELEEKYRIKRREVYYIIDEIKQEEFVPDFD